MSQEPSLVGSFAHASSVADLSSSPQLFLPTQAFLEALRCGEARSVRQALSECHSTECTWCDEEGNTVLHYAAALAGPECLLELLQSRISFVFAQNVYGQTPLHVACRCARTITPVLLLVTKFGTTATLDCHGNTFLHLLLANAYLKEAQLALVVESLLVRGSVTSLVNVVNNDGCTLYDVAVRWHQKSASLFQLLLRHGAVSGVLLFNDEVETVVVDEEEERVSVVSLQESAYAQLRLAAQVNCERIRTNRHQRRKLAEKEAKKRVVVLDREDLSMKKLRKKAATEFHHIEARQATLECGARLLQRVGRGFETRCALCRLRAQRQVERVAAEREAARRAAEQAEAARIAAAAEAAKVAAEREKIANMAAAEREARQLLENEENAARQSMLETKLREEKECGEGPSPSPSSSCSPEPVRIELSQLPERLFLWLQSKVRMRSQRRTFRQLRKSTVLIQRAWRQRFAEVVRRRQKAADVLLAELRRFQLRGACTTFVETHTVEHIKAMLREITRLVTQLVWRENFCSGFRDIVFMQRRRFALPPPRPTRFQRWQKLSEKMEPFLLLTQVVVSLFLLIYMGCIPRSSATRVHNKVDITFICVQVVISCCLPWCWWRIWDLAVEATALVCAAASRYGGVIVITLFVLKLPFVIRGFAPRHSGTRTYCRAIEYSAVYLLMFLPFGVAGIGATVRGTMLNDQLLTSYGNWGSVLLRLVSTVSPQYTVMLLLSAYPTQSHHKEILVPLRAQEDWFPLPNGEQLVRLRMPLVQLIFFQGALFMYTWMAIAVGTHNAIRHHYDISDETKLKLNKHRFRNEGKEELFDAHRAANIEALGQQLDGVMWEDDVRAAKEAVDASHYDHNTNFTVHRFVRRVQDTLGNSSNAALSGASRPLPNSKQRVKDNPKWDCRNEDPQSRGSYDVEVIETALGMVERRSFGERLVQRQWTGAPLRKEMNLVICAMLVMAAVKPNLYAMESAFSAVFTVELLVSLYFLRIEFIFSHYFRLLLRIFCVVVGFVPPAVPFVAFRCLRLVEGWSQVFSIPGMVRWAMLYLLLSFVTIWMISYVAALQVLSSATLGTRQSMCSNRGECLAISIRELVLPAFTPEHISPTSEAPVMAMLVFFTHFFFIPFLLAITLHPLLRLSNFIGRFLRLVVQSLHKDVVDYLENYLEGSSWYTHWGLRCDVPVNIIVRLKVWLNDTRRRRIVMLWRRSTQNSLVTNFFIPQKTFVKGYEAAPDDEEERHTVLTEIICRGEFATFKENSALDGSKRRGTTLLPTRFVIRNFYVHCANVVLTFASIAFLWIADASVERRDARVIVSTVIHLASILLSLAVIPRDSTAFMTLVSAGALFSAVVLVLIPGRRYRGYYCLRFLSLLRLGQLQVFPFRETRRFVKMYMDSAVKILFPVAVIGGASYIAELLRAQIFMVKFDTRPWEGLNWSDAATVATLRANMSHEVFLAVMPREHTSRPNVQQTSDLFSTYFREDAYILYSIFNFWVLPAICISTCLSYLFWVGANLRDTNRLMVNMVPLWEDPITTAGFSWYQWLYRYVGNVVLVVSLVFGCIFSPATTATANDLHLFFGFEIGFTLCGLAEAILSSSFAVHRCGRSSASWLTCEKHAKHSQVLLGDCVFLVCEVVQLLYYCIAIALCATLVVEREHCLISPGAYATYFITLRFVFLLRMLSREFLFSLLKRVLSTGCGVASVVIFFVGSASALADVYAAATQTPYTAATWCAAFDAMFRLTFTSAIPAQFDGYWVPFNATATALAMHNASASVYVVEQNFTASRLAFVLSAVGKAILSSIAGLVIASVAVPVGSYFLQPLPAKSLLLYRTLCGGLPALVKFGVRNHDDMRPHARRRIQARKFARLFTPQGIPSWALPHLLEELDICRPVRQRRFMYALARLLEYLPTAEKRQRQVREYMHMWDSYRCGGPAHLLFSKLPVYPPDSSTSASGKVPNPYTAAVAATAGACKDERTKRYVAPLRLVQALAIFELGFPADSSVGSKLWMDFFSVVQKMRGATLLQSLWRMYREEKVFDADPQRSTYERALIAYLRRSFRKHKIRSTIRFLSCVSFQEAMKYEREVFNPNTGHYDVINRLRGHFSKLQASNDFWRQWRATELQEPI
jgi:hypothetical protein